MALCVVHKETQAVMYKFRSGNKTPEDARAQADEFLKERFPSPLFEVTEIDFTQGREAGVKTGWYISVMFEGADDEVVIGHRYKNEDKCIKDKAKLYDKTPGVVSARIIPAAEALEKLAIE